VHHCAALVQSREHSVDGLMQKNQVASPDLDPKLGLTKLSSNRSSLWARKNPTPDVKTEEAGFQLEK
jgi:hypothetical protein